MITINNKLYSERELRNIYTSYSNLDGYYREILEFIAQWMDDTEYITVETTGSTGTPKKIIHKKVHMMQSAINTQQYLGLLPSDSALLCLPVKYISGKMMIVRAFVTKFNLIIQQPSSNPFSMINARVDFASITPYQLSKSFETLKNMAIRNIIVGGAEIPASLEKKLDEIPSNIYATYGMTETCSHIALRKVNGKDASPAYEALAGVSFSTNENYCLIINAKNIADKPIETRDVVELIDDKHFKWLGRFDNVINSGGIKIFPEEIEKKIETLIPYPFIIAGEKDENLSETVCLYIEHDTELSNSEKNQLIDKLKTVLEKYQMPRKIRSIKQFVYSNNGKLLRKETIGKL
jgi:O-succinylbenzoic acid--CoA ligase